MNENYIYAIIICGVMLFGVIAGIVIAWASIQFGVKLAHEARCGDTGLFDKTDLDDAETKMIERDEDNGN